MAIAVCSVVVRILGGTAVGDVAAGGVVVVEVVGVEPVIMIEVLSPVIILNTEMEMSSIRVTRVTQLPDDGIGVDGVADGHGDRTRDEMGVLGGVVVDSITIDVVLDVNVAAPRGIPVGIRIGTATVLDVGHSTGGGSVDVVTFVTVEVVSTVARLQWIIIDFILRSGTAHAVVPGATVDRDTVVVDRQHEGTVGQSLVDV